MAKTIKPSDVKTAGGPKPEDIKRAITEASRHKKSAAEYSGNHGSVVAAFCEKTGINRKAFTWARSLFDLEDAKRQPIIRDFGTLCRALGFFDQGDLFNPVEVDGDEAASPDDTTAAAADGADAAVKAAADRAETKPEPSPAAKRGAARAAKAAASRAEPEPEAAAEAAAEARKAEAEADAARARKTADEMEQAPDFVGKSYSQRMAEQNVTVDAEIRKTSTELAGEIDAALGIH